MEQHKAISNKFYRTLKDYNLISHIPNLLLIILAECWPLVVLFFAMVLEMRHIADSSWQQIFLYNSDSLTLPLIRESLSHHEAFMWVFSSQLLLFPEGVLYALSSLLAPSIRASLILNSFLTVFLIYTLIRFIFKLMSKRSRFYQQASALFLCLILLTFMLLERQADVNQQGIATLLLFNTYYYGVIVVGLFSLLTTAFFFKQGLEKERLYVKSILALDFLFVVLATFSDPLYIVQFVVPFIFAVSVTYYVSKISASSLKQIVGIQIMGSFLGYLLRYPLRNFIGQSLSSHVDINGIGPTLNVLHNSIVAAMKTPSGILEYFTLFIIVTFSAGASIYFFYNRVVKGSAAPLTFIFCLFGIVEPMILLLFTIITGSQTTRYLIPMFVFPLLSFLVIMERGVFLKLVVCLTTGLSALVILTGLASIHSAQSMLSSNDFGAESCMAQALDNKSVVGVGQYWTARPLDVYAAHGERVLQVNYKFSIYPWLINLASYKNKHFSFVIVDKEMTGPSSILVADVNQLGPPSKVSNCGSFYVYQFYPNTNGYIKLNKLLDNSYKQLTKIRGEGQIASYIQNSK